MTNNICTILKYILNKTDIFKVIKCNEILFTK